MKLLWLKEIIGDAYTEDMDAAACQAIGKDFALPVRTSTPKKHPCQGAGGPGGPA